MDGPTSTTDDKRQDETTAQTQDDSNTGVGRDRLHHGSGAGDDLRPGCGFVATGRVVTGGPGDKRSRCECRRAQELDATTLFLETIQLHK